MVHIPVFGIDVPEPRIALLLPDAVSGLVKMCARTMDAAYDTLYPLSPAAEQVLMDEYIGRMPREFDRVMSRCLDNKIKNDDQLSSEVEEASFDWYRRMIRTAVVGETEDEQEDLTAFKLGLDEPSPQQQVRETYQAQHLGTLFNPDVPGVLAGVAKDPFSAEALFASAPPSASQLERDATARAAAAAALQETERRAQEARRAAKEARRHLVELEGSVASGPRRAAVAVANAGVGVGLSLLLVKGLGLAVKKLLAARGPRAPKKKSSRAGSVQVLQQQAQVAQQQQQQQAQAAQQAAAATSTAAAARRSRTAARKR